MSASTSGRFRLHKPDRETRAWLALISCSGAVGLALAAIVTAVLR